MAIESEMKNHEKTYSGFTRLFKIGTIVSAVVALLVVLIIAR